MLSVNSFRVLGALSAVVLWVAPAHAQQGRHRMMGMGGREGRGAMHHDSAASADMSVIHELIMNHGRITRSVTTLPNGIRTVTESDDSLLARRIKEHVVTMYARVESGVDPGWPMESEALRKLYTNSALIRTVIDSTAQGIVVTQTSSDSATVTALQEHASEVTALVSGGRAAMHAAMMQRHGAMMPGAQRGAAMDATPRGPGRGKAADPPPHVHRRPPR